MARLVQVGVGSGGMVVLDLLCRDPRWSAITLIEPDVYQPHNAVRHYFPPTEAGQSKLELAAGWVRRHRPDLELKLLPLDLLNPGAQTEIEAAAATADFGVCAVDNEAAKYHWDGLMRRHRRPWTLGEVLSGGIGGLVHRFEPGGPCYGCVASFLKREAKEEPEGPAPDYSQPGGPVAETTIPASAASIHAVASLQALVTLDLLEGTTNDWTSLLLTLKAVPGVFAEAYRPHRFAIPKAELCLVCRPRGPEIPSENLDAAVASALARLGDPRAVRQ